ncbi:hypothetical protein AVEN_125294-1 [Araneus ventricosus]|uniref:Uncharacterized protein n=1 Tax=Araneus ventricosus TaxID=182803 RepID=A0A4Y2EM84_ARAVE|nr:hypothetical protein AVEN_125294-1 [Araneus ventricosus]
MTRTTPEQPPPLQASAPHQREDISPLHMIQRTLGPIHDGSSVESGFEPGALRSQSRDLATMPQRPPQKLRLRDFGISPEYLVTGTGMDTGKDIHLPRWPGGKVSTLGRRAPGPKPDSTEEPPVSRPRAHKIRRGQMSPRWCGFVGVVGCGGSLARGSSSCSGVVLVI